jgi:hypothetical protein
MRDVVSGKRGPSEGNLGKVACAYRNPIKLIGFVKEELGSVPSLDIFKDYILVTFVREVPQL